MIRPLIVRFVPAVLLTLLAIVHAQLWFGRGSISNVTQLQQKLVSAHKPTAHADD